MNLFDWAEQRSRDGDPETAKQSDAEIRHVLNVRCLQFLEGLKALGTATANEVALSVTGDNRGMHDSIRRRASDLVRLGRIRQIGVRECDVTGKRVALYEVVDTRNDGQ